MVLFRPARPGDRAAMEEVWQLSFGDRPGDIDRFFRLCGGWVQSMVLEEAGQVRGAVQLLPVTLTGERGERWRCAYVYAVCIHPDHRGEGLGRAMTAYADFYLEEKGFDCAATVPSTPELHRFYALQGFGECFRHRQSVRRREELPAPAAGDSARRVGPGEYGPLREGRLAGGLHLSYGGEALAYQQALCEASGGGLFALTLDGGTGCACVEMGPEGPAVKELLVPAGLEDRGLAALAAALPGERWTVRTPDPAGEPFGMVRWYRRDIARAWDWVHGTGHLGLAFD